DHREELGRSLWTFGAELAATAEATVRSPEWESAAPLVEQGRRAVALVRRVPARDARPDDLDSRLSRVESAFAAAQERKRRVAEVLALLDQPKLDLRAIH